MESIVMILVFVLIIMIGYCFIYKLGTFLDEGTGYQADVDGTKLIHLGFDTPFLAEDFINKMEEDKESVEVIVYSGGKEDLMSMLLIGELDYAILTNPVKQMDETKVRHKEVLLQPRSLRTSAADIHIELANNTSIKAVAFWVPGWTKNEGDLEVLHY